MPKKKHSELTAGLFVLGALALGVGVLLWLGAAGAFRTRGQNVVFRVAQSAGSVGVLEGAAITLGDAEIGRIDRIEARPAEGACLYFGQLDRTDVKVHSDANALVVSPPIGQAKIVLLAAGQADTLGDAEHPIPLSGGLDQVMARVNTMAENLERTSLHIRRELEPNRPGSLIADVHGVVRKIDIAADTVGKFVMNVEGESVATNPNSLAGKLHRSAGDINAATASLAHQMDPNADGTFLAHLDRAAGSVDTQLDPAAKGSLLGKVHAATDDLGGMIAETRPELKKTMTSVSSAAGAVESYAKKDLGEILAGLREANTKILKTLSDFQVVGEQVKEVVATNRDNIDETLDNLSFVSLNLKAASEEIRRNPWRLLYNPEKKELRSQNIYAAVRSFSDGAAQLDQAIAKLRKLKQIESDSPEYAKTREAMLKNLSETFAKFSKVEEKLWQELQK